MNFKQLLLNSQEKLEKTLNQLILFITRQKSTKKTLCYYSSDISKAYHNTHSIGDSDKLKRGFAYECYHCSKFFTRPGRHKKHIENCA